jgi:hypothetical protein
MKTTQNYFTNCKVVRNFKTPSAVGNPDGVCERFSSLSIFYFHFLKRSNDQPLKDALNELLDSYHLKERVNELRLKGNWEKIFGKTISKYTQKISVRNKKLFINIDSASLRHELTFNKAKMIERINESIAPGFVDEIILK